MKSAVHTLTGLLFLWQPILLILMKLKNIVLICFLPVLLLSSTFGVPAISTVPVWPNFTATTHDLRLLTEISLLIEGTHTSFSISNG